MVCDIRLTPIRPGLRRGIATPQFTPWIHQAKKGKDMAEVRWGNRVSARGFAGSWTEKMKMPISSAPADFVASDHVLQLILRILAFRQREIHVATHGRGRAAGWKALLIEFHFHVGDQRRPEPVAVLAAVPGSYLCTGRPGAHVLPHNAQGEVIE